MYRWFFITCCWHQPFLVPFLQMDVSLISLSFSLNEYSTWMPSPHSFTAFMAYETLNSRSKAWIINSCRFAWTGKSRMRANCCSEISVSFVLLKMAIRFYLICFEQTYVMSDGPINRGIGEGRVSIHPFKQHVGIDFPLHSAFEQR